MKNFHLDLVRVTEAGAISAAEWVGRGNKEEADKAATEAMRDRLNNIDFKAEIAIGEGKKDESFGLFEGEDVGQGRRFDPNMPEQCQIAEITYSIAVDPIEGTTPVAGGYEEAMSVIALANKDCFYKTDSFYMEKLAVGPKISGVSLNYPAEVNVRMVATQLGKAPRHVTVCVMDRPRHDDLVKQLRVAGCRIKFIKDCDVTACIAACEEDSGIDMYHSIGGAPEAVIAAAAMKCMGGYMECREWNEEANTLGRILKIDDLARGDTMFVATGITDGKLLRGVQFKDKGPVTNSIAMRSGSHTIRRIETDHGN